MIFCCEGRAEFGPLTRSAVGLAVFLLLLAAPVYAISSSNIPLTSPVYGYLEMLAGMGLITGDIRANKIIGNAEAARMVLEATENIAAQENAAPAWSSTLFRFVPPKKPDPFFLSFAKELVARTRDLLPPEAFLKVNLDRAQAAVKSSHRTISSANIPLNSPIYGYLDKLAGMGLITTDIKGLRPYSKAEAARLTLEAAEKHCRAGYCCTGLCHGTGDAASRASATRGVSA